MNRAYLAILPVILLCSPVASALPGSYLELAVCTPQLGCIPGPLDSDPGTPLNAFGIVHPMGYVGTGGAIQIPICVSADHPELIAPTQRAIATWNALVPTVSNCLGCTLWEEPEPEGVLHAESTILHELGHCAMGLDHPDRLWDYDSDGTHNVTSYSRSREAAHPGGINAGPDTIRGSFDDVQLGPSGNNPADSVSWFRIADNNPVVIDGTVIDSSTYSRSVSVNLPPNQYAANANRRVAESLGAPFTQTVMYSRGVEGQHYSGLSADDVNMVRMGMTGTDTVAGTPDDYTIELVYVSPCATNPAAINVTLTPLGDPKDPADDGAVGSCEGIAVDYSFPPPNPLNARHYSLVRLFTAFAPFIRLNEKHSWDFGPPLTPIVFQDGFETADLSEWSDAVPALTSAPTSGDGASP